MIRVIVAEDSPTARALILEVLASDPDIAVIGEARTGGEVVEMTLRLHPDLITMDIEMPGMDGLAAARQIMERVPTPIVVVSGSTNRSDTDRSLDALAAGALYVIDKPKHPFAPEFEDWRAQLVAAVKAMAHVKVVRRLQRGAVRTTPQSVALEPLGEVQQVRLVAIAASTGGPAVLQEILRSLSPEFPAPIAIVQHIARGFSEALADWLQQGARVRVKVAVHGEPLRASTAYLAPDDRQFGVGEGRVVLSDAAKIGSFRPSATYLFQSSAQAYGASAVAIILTGMGADGVDGLRSVHAAGGTVYAQDEASCVVFGMPREAIRAGVVDAVLTPSAIAHQLNRLTRRVQSAGQNSGR
ncbi:MAG TPA: chemotaxis-specific protein-glutamate methyltransferase CheB [Gemmatimonadaceae bacterium]|nr:chemotaxis-specific protein-glutamate methyltransferase CheB [Gemmatimonadaceae bacterium]